MNALVLFIGQQQRKQQKNKTFKSMGATNRYLFGKSLLDLCTPIMIALILTAAIVSILFPYYQAYTQWQGYGIYENYSNQIDIDGLSAYAFKWLGWILLLFFGLSSLFIVRIIKTTGFRSFAFLRNTLIVSQIFIGCFFFFISLSLYKQVRFTQKTDKGIIVENITQVDVGYYTSIDFNSLGEEFLKSPYIEDVTFTVTPILIDNGDHYLSYIGDYKSLENPEEVINNIDVLGVEPNFFDFFGIKLKEGHLTKEKNDVIINETQRRVWQDKNPLGKPAKIGLLSEAQISGVIQDYYYSTMQYPIKGLFFHLNTFTIPYQYLYFKTQPENQAKAIEYVNTVLEKVETGDVAPGKRFIQLTDMQAEFNRPEKMLFRIFGFLSFICILVVSFGIYSLITLTIEQRKKEIAIRKINGAEIRDILVLFIRNYLLLVIAGNILALPVAYFFINSWLENYVYRTSLSAWLFAVVFIATCLIVLLSIVEKVRVAAKENPAEVIKTE
jgi:ABC-type antimicrobial peptide transport system permease subunit